MAGTLAALGVDRKPGPSPQGEGVGPPMRPQGGNTVDSTASAPLAILLSEEPDEGLLVSTLLRRAGMGVTEVGRVAQVAAAAARRRPEMLVLDLGADVEAAQRRCALGLGDHACLAMAPGACRAPASGEALLV
jgi:hypothetical protein